MSLSTEGNTTNLIYMSGASDFLNTSNNRRFWPITMENNQDTQLITEQSGDLLMIDIETGGIEPGCPVLTIGAVRFDREGVISGTLDLAISYIESERAGLATDDDTVAWWTTQPQAAYELAWRPAATTPGKQAFEQLFDFAAGCKDIWACGSDFDFPIIKAAAKRFGADMTKMWPFRYQRDYRTLRKCLPHITLEREGTHHAALDDAMHQANHLIMLLNELEKLKPEQTLV